MRVLYVQYTNPGAYPPLVRGARLLAESGADVTMLGTRVLGLDALDAPPVRGVDVRLTAAPAGGWRLKAHYARYAAWVAREGAALKPDWIYASDLLSAPIALAAAALTGARVLYHEHDAPSLAHESWMIKRCLEARGRLLRQADIVVTPNAERSAHLSAAAGGRRVVTVWNCPLRPAQPIPREADSPELRWSSPVFEGVPSFGTAGRALPRPIVVAVADSFGNGVPGALVAFTARAGRVVPARARTDDAGRAAVRWTLGNTPGEQRLEVSVSGGGGRTAAKVRAVSAGKLKPPRPSP